MTCFPFFRKKNRFSAKRKKQGAIFLPGESHVEEGLVSDLSHNLN
jgi:hypothetical protein